MLGRLPWFAFERRSFALRFLVFFDIGSQTIGEISLFATGLGHWHRDLP
jgi:hypothetical protein